MRVSRLFIDASLSPSFDNQAEIAITDDRAHYIKNVLRLRQGDVLTLFNAEGGEYAAVIKAVEKKHLILNLTGFNPDNRTPGFEINLGLCVIKRDAMDFAIQKATELGVTNIYPLISERVTVSEKQLKSRINHWENIASSACEQCGMNILPNVHRPQGIESWCNQPAGSKLCALPGSESFGSSQTSESVNLLVGPEGGFSEDEQHMITNNNFSGVDLGNRILRAETAVISLMSLVLNRF